MFTGIVTAVGEILRVERSADRLALTVRSPYPDLARGESVALNGACLTVVDTEGTAFRVDVIVTTRGRTVLESLRPGSRVNLERALAVGDRLGGHFVQGHVDGLGEVVAVRDVEDARFLDVRLPAEVAELSVPHGSITLDGVSLTINAIPAPDVVQVALIPFTLAHTTLGERRPGDRVQVEGDMLGKYTRRLLRKEP
ncbi:MAG TPA: riboflavin synthase [Gemmatimonadales bacterium]|nr:riboflavin synthase [Gemmatimonadales bacterium]